MLTINQDATFSIGDFGAYEQVNYTMETPGNGAYVFNLEGVVKIDGTTANKRDAIAVYNTSSFTIKTEAHARFLII